MFDHKKAKKLDEKNEQNIENNLEYDLVLA